MYHPTRGGVRGGRDQFKWDDVKVDKHRENYLGHSIKAPVGRWQKGKDLHWYARDKKSNDADLEAAREEIKRIKEEEEQAMREALGLAPKRSDRPRGNRLDKNEYSELIKRGSTTEDLGGGHAEAANVHGLGFARTSRPWTAESSSLTAENLKEVHLPEDASGATRPQLTSGGSPEDDDDSGDGRRKRRREERKQEKREKRQREYDDKKKHKRDKGKRRHDSD